MKTKLTHKQQQANQFAWELWFVASIAITFTVILIGTFENSRLLADYPALAIIVLINLITCVVVGLKKREQPV